MRAHATPSPPTPAPTPSGTLRLHEALVEKGSAAIYVPSDEGAEAASAAAMLAQVRAERADMHEAMREVRISATSRRHLGDISRGSVPGGPS